MLNEPISIVAEITELAEHKNYLELVSRICYYDEPNLNGVKLPFNDSSLEIAKTIINMPVQAKYRVNKDNLPDLGGHEMHKTKDNQVYFSTVSIGTHTDVWISEDTVEVNGISKTLPCLFAKYRIWTRYPNYVAAVKRLFNENNLHGSWEINISKYEYSENIMTVTDYEFNANCLLGSSNPPAYGKSANAISMAELNNNSNTELLVAEALSQDIISHGLDINNNENKEEISEMAKIEAEKMVAGNVTPDSAPADTNVNTATENENKAEQKEETAENKTESKEDTVTETAQLTVYDLRRKISEACRTKLGKWCYVSFFFPNEKEVWCEYESESELDYVKFTYEVSEDDTITVSEPEYVKLTVSVAQVNETIASLNKDVETAKAELELKNEAITKASEKIQELNVQISELTPYKEKVEAAEKERIENEIAEDKKRLKEKMLKGNLFTEAEISEKNIAELIEARNESAINSLIADKFIASFDSTNKSETSVETAEISVPTANLESNDDTDVYSAMGKFLF